MDQLKDPFGLDPDSTQELVLATSETFRLGHQLLAIHKGLEDTLDARNNPQSRRKRYDRMKVWLWIWTGPCMCSSAPASTHHV